MPLVVLRTHMLAMTNDANILFFQFQSKHCVESVWNKKKKLERNFVTRVLCELCSFRSKTVVTAPNNTAVCLNWNHPTMLTLRVAESRLLLFPDIGRKYPENKWMFQTLILSVAEKPSHQTQSTIDHFSCLISCAVSQVDCKIQSVAIFSVIWRCSSAVLQAEQCKQMTVRALSEWRMIGKTMEEQSKNELPLEVEFSNDCNATWWLVIYWDQ